MDFQNVQSGKALYSRCSDRIFENQNHYLYDVTDEKGKRYCLKKYDNGFLPKDKIKENIETSVNDYDKYQGVCRIYECFRINNIFYIVQEFFDKTLDKIQKIQGEDEKISIILQLIDSAEQLHKNSIVHKFIKPNRICISQESKQIKCKLIDFGEYHEIYDLRRAINREQCNFDAPESIFSKPTTASDIWSIGIHLFFGNDQSEIQKSLHDYCENQTDVQGKIFKLPIPFHQKLSLRQMLNPDPKIRPSITQVKNVFTSPYNQTGIPASVFNPAIACQNKSFSFGSYNLEDREDTKQNIYSIVESASFRKLSESHLVKEQQY